MGREYLHPLYQVAAAPQVTAKQSFLRAKRVPRALLICILVIFCLHGVLLLTSFVMDSYFSVELLLIDYIPEPSCGDNMSTLLTDRNIVLETHSGLWFKQYKRKIDLNYSSDLLSAEPHFTIAKSVADLCLQPRVGILQYVDWIKLCQSLCLGVFLCNLLTVVFWRNAFIYVSLAAGCIALFQTLLAMIWVADTALCFQLALWQFENETVHLIYGRKFRFYLVANGWSLWLLFSCNLIFVAHVPAALYLLLGC